MVLHVGELLSDQLSILSRVGALSLHAYLSTRPPNDNTVVIHNKKKTNLHTQTRKPSLHSSSIYYRYSRSLLLVLPNMQGATRFSSDTEVFSAL